MKAAAIGPEGRVGQGGAIPGEWAEAHRSDEPPMLRLDARGMIRDCNPACEALFQYRRSELAWRHASMLLPDLADLELLQDGEPNPRLRYLSRIGQCFPAITKDGRCFASELFLNVLDKSGAGQLSLIVRPAGQAAGGGGRS